MKIRKLLAAACGCFALLFGTTAAQAAENVVGGGGTVVEVDGTVESLKTGLETAMRDNDRETFTTVKLSENITFGEGDTWEPMLLKPGVKLVLDGNGKTITGLPNSLFALTGPGSKNGQYLRINDLTFEKARAVNTDTNYVSVILTGALDYVREATFKNVTIDDASVSSGDYAGAFIGYASLSEADDTVTFENCKVLNSTIQGGGSVGALIGHANGGKAGVVKVVSAEVKGNKITSSEKDFNTDGTPKYKAGAVFGTLGTTDIAVNATVSGNTVKSGDYGITTVCGRQGSAGTLTITGGTYDNSPIDADSTWAGVSATCTLTETVVAGKTIYTVAEAYAAKVKVGETETSHTDLAAALKAAVAAENATVEILRDITFAPNDTWTPVKIGWGKTLVINGNSKTIKNLPGCLFGSTFDTGDVQDGSAFTMTNLKFEKPKASALASSNKQYVAVVLALAYGMDVTFDGVEIDGADVRGGNDSFVAGFVGWCNGMSGKNTVTLRNCALRNSTLVSCGSVGGLVAYTTVTPEQAVSLVVENCEVTGNTIVGTELKDGNPRTDIVGSVVGTIGAGVASVSATVSSNKVYGSTSAVDAETLTKATDEVTTVYGRGKGGELTIAGGTYDARPFNEGDDWAKVAKGYDMKANGDGTYGVTAHIVAKVGGEEFNSLAAALTAAVAAKDATVEIVDDITFDEGDTWTPVKIGAGKALVIKGNGKTIKNLPGCLFGSTFDTGDVQDGSVFTMTNLKFEKPKASALASSGKQFVAVVLALAYGMDVTFDGVEIDGADVRGGNDSFVAGFVGWCNGWSGRNTVTLRNCALRNSTLVSRGSVGGLVAYTAAVPAEAVSLVVENCEVTGNTIVGTELKDGKPRTDIVGSVVGSIGAGDATVSAKVSGNEVYGSTSAVDAETLTKATDEVTTVYGRGKGGELTIAGGTYDARPFNEGDDWAKVAKDCTLAGNDTDGWTVAYFIKANGVGYATLEAAFAAAEPDADGIVTYEIGGKAEVTGAAWVKILKDGLAGVTQVKFVGTTADAEICLVTAGSILSEQAYDVDVTFTDLTLSRQNPAYVNDIGFGARYFSTWLRNQNAAENTVIYTHCTFPNGVCNNQYGKTVFNDCTFCNQQSGGDTGYNLWVYGGDVKVNGGTFTGTRGVKVYNEGAARDDISVSITGTTFDGLTEKSAILASKPCNVTVANVTVKNCAKGLFTRDIVDDEATISANGTGISGTFAITSATTAEAAKKEFNLTGGTFTAAVDADYCAKGYDMKANGDGTWGVTAHIVAKVGARAFNSLADALTAAITHRDADDVVVKIVDDITFDEGDEWTPVMLPAGQKLVIDGKAEDGSNHVIKGLPASLADKTGSWQVLRISNLTLKSAKVTNTAANQGTAVVLGHASDMLELTFDNVVIDGATVQAADWAGAFVGYAAGYSDESNGAVFQTVTFRNCKVLNSTVESSGSVGALIGHASGSTYTRVVVENAEIRNNVIKCTKTDSKDKAGAVFGTVGEGQPTEAHPDGGLFVDAVVSNNTVTSDDQTITTIYGRRGNTGTLTLTGGTYASAPLADGDSAWAKVDEWCTLVEQDGLFKVVDNLATLGNVKARQRYPWNGLVDITFELKSKNAARIFIVAEYMDGGVTKRLTMTTAKLVNDDKTEREVNVSTGFEVPAQATAKTIHVIWDSTTAVPTRLSGVTFKVYAK